MRISAVYKGYRPDIDGLRAIAVLSVIIFHINPNLLPGGFVGVDIFFVISGYLISLHIFKDLSKGQFSLIEFYRRRIKRIAPAMLVVIFITVILTQFLFRPEDAEKVAESGLWSLLSLANVYFWLFQDTSYFAPASNELPLLHLWSLGVEEQFYIFWPLVLLAVHKISFGRYFFGILFLVTLGSFLLGEYLFAEEPSFVYYMLPTRAGELLIGALLAQIIFKRDSIEISHKTIGLISWSGLLLVSGSLIFLSEKLVFPGLWAIPPTLGAGMLIFAGHYSKNGPSRFLILPPLVWVGVISYSAYLWHWPILAFLRYSNIEVDLTLGFAYLTLVIFLAWATYIYIETPARRSSNTAFQVFVKYYIVPGSVIAFLSLSAMKLDGYGPRWFSDDYRSTLTNLRDEIAPAYKYDYVCQSQLITDQDVQNKNCVLGDQSKNIPRAILWGDSNAAHYIGMLGVFAREGGFLFRNLQIGSCPPLSSDASEFVKPIRVADCNKSRKTILTAIDDYPVVIISASWSSYQSRSDKFLGAFYETVEKLLNKGKLVILVGKAPVIDNYDRLCKEKNISLPFIKCDMSGLPLSKEVAKINEKLRQFSLKNVNVEYYDITDRLCAGESCSAFDENGNPIYYDPSHLTLSASWEIGAQIHEEEGEIPHPFNLIASWTNKVDPM